MCSFQIMCGKSVQHLLSTQNEQEKKKYFGDKADSNKDFIFCPESNQNSCKHSKSENGVNFNKTTNFISPESKDATDSIKSFFRFINIPSSLDSTLYELISL